MTCTAGDVSRGTRATQIHTPRSSTELPTCGVATGIARGGRPRCAMRKEIRGESHTFRTRWKRTCSESQRLSVADEHEASNALRRMGKASEGIGRNLGGLQWEMPGLVRRTAGGFRRAGAARYGAMMASPAARAARALWHVAGLWQRQARAAHTISPLHSPATCRRRKSVLAGGGGLLLVEERLLQEN